MFVQLSVAGIVLLFVISGVFLPDEYFQRTADEILYDEQEETNSEYPEDVTYWKKALGSLDVTLGLSAGLGTILTAILSYRFSHGRWRRWGEKFQSWLWRNRICSKEVQIIMEPQATSVYSSDSKENLVDHFHVASDHSNLTYDGDRFDCLDVTSNTSTFMKSEPSDTKTDDDSASTLLFEMSEPFTKNEPEEPKYKTLEARIMAVEGSLMNDIDYRMKVFEQQLEEFRTKMQRADDFSCTQFSIVSEEMDSPHLVPSGIDELSPGRQPSCCDLNAVKSKLKKSLSTRRYQTSKSNIFGVFSTTDKFNDSCSDTTLKIESTTNITSAGDACAMSCQSSDNSSDVSSDKESKKSSINTKIDPVSRPPLSRTRITKMTDSKNDLAPSRITTSSSVNTRKSDKSEKSENSFYSDKINPVTGKRIQPRSKQQIRAILQQTNEKLAQRNKLKQK